MSNVLLLLLFLLPSTSVMHFSCHGGVADGVLFIWVIPLTVKRLLSGEVIYFVNEATLYQTCMSLQGLYGGLCINVYENGFKWDFSPF